MEILIWVACIGSFLAIILGLVALYMVYRLTLEFDNLLIELMGDEDDFADIEMYENEVFVN